MTSPLGICAYAWAQEKTECGKRAVDRVAMGFISDEPRDERRKAMIVEYRERCRIEEASSGNRG